MDQNSIKTYMENDFRKALEFYDKRACQAKRWYRFYSISLIVISSVLTPLVALAPDEMGWRIFLTFLSAAIVALTGLLAHLKSQENWLSYRATWDMLERERRHFATGIGEYKDAADKNARFVERVEAILAREGSDFYIRHAKSEEQGKKPAESGQPQIVRLNGAPKE